MKPLDKIFDFSRTFPAAGARISRKGFATHTDPKGKVVTDKADMPRIDYGKEKDKP